MASEWFMRRNGEEDGPFSSEQLKAMARNGLITKEDLVWKEGMDDWRPAGESRRLFPRSARGSRHGSASTSRSRSSSGKSASAAMVELQPLSRLALPTDRRLRMALVGGAGLGLLLMLTFGILLLQSSGEPVGEDGPVPSDTPEPATAVSRTPPVPVRQDPARETPASDRTSTALDTPDLNEAANDGGRQPDGPLPDGLSKIATYELPREIGERTAAQATAFAFSPDNRFLAVGLDDGRLLLYDTVDGGPPKRTERAHPGGDRASPLSDRTTSISFSPSGNRVGWGTNFRHFAIVDMADSSLAWRSPVMAKGLRADLDPPQVALKDDDTILVATSSGIGELSTIDICRPLNGGTPWQGMGLDAVVGDAQITFVAKTGQGMTSRGPGRWPLRRTGASRLVAIGRDGRTGGMLIADASNSTVTIFELGGDTVTTRTEGLPTITGSGGRLVVRDRQSAMLAAASKLVVISGADGGLSVDLASPGPATMLAADADHRHVVVATADGQISLLAVGGQEKTMSSSIMHRWSVPGLTTTQAAISADGTRLALTGKGSVSLFQIGEKPADQ